MPKLLSISTAEQLTLELLETHELPKSVIVTDYHVGFLDNGKQWANLEIADTQEYEALKTINLEARAEKYKLKINLSDTDREPEISKYVGQKLSLSEIPKLQILMASDKFGNFKGFDLKAAL